MVTLKTNKMSAASFLEHERERPDARLELIDGEVRVAPYADWNHSTLAARLTAILQPHIEAHDLGVLALDVSTPLDDRNVRRPDLVFVSKARIAILKKPRTGPLIPDLAIEIVSPSSVVIDRRDKFDLYARSGVANYWIIDPAHRTAESYVLESGAYRLAARGEHDQVVTFAPFPLLRLALGAIWPPDWL